MVPGNRRERESARNRRRDCQVRTVAFRQRDQRRHGGRPAGCVEGEAGVADVLAALLVLFVLIIDVVPAIDVDMLDDENVNGLAAVMTLSEFTLPLP